MVTYVFTYQYRGLARLEGQQRDRESRQAIESQSPVASQQAPVASSQVTVSGTQKAREASRGQKAVGSGQKAETKKSEPSRKPTNAPVGTKIGRNDPCWCGSGKKYKNCHMASDSK